jgi:hypothetical protein
MAGHAGRARLRITAVGVVAAVGLLLGTGPAPAGGPKAFTPGAPGLGDPYFPLDGNGGYDVRKYVLDLKYDPATDELDGVAKITARATQNLSQFNLDLDGLTVHAIVVEGRRATWIRAGDELTITPAKGLRDGRRFTTTIAYSGVPQPLDEFGGASGFFHTDDGALIIGEPHVADTWFPVNDHPTDKAAYVFRITVPAGLEAVANGELEDERTKGGWTTWTWEADEPMASYLATTCIGQFDLRAYKEDGIRFWDAVDPDLYVQFAPRTGNQFAISQQADVSYKRLARTIAVPAGGATVSFWIDRETELGWDFVFVEAHTVGDDDWTTLPDLNGNTSDDTGFPCPFWLEFHPFLTHYQSDNGDGTCSPEGSSGTWSAASGDSEGYEQWRVDLGAYAGSTVELSISYASDDSVQPPGVVVDDVVVSSGAGTTSFEADGDTFDGWTVPGPPTGSPGNANDWIVGTSAQAPPPVGDAVDASFARHGEIVDFLSGIFGPYPFSAAGGIVDDFPGISFALENQTRPIYAKSFFGDPVGATFVVVHELAHQWVGDSLAVAAWQHIWLNEGFATYMEWLWGEREDLGTAQETFDFFYNEAFPADHPFWTLTIGDPGPEHLFDFPVYARGAMTLHQLRLAVGDQDFFEILRRWTTRNEDDNVTTDKFIRLAERVSGVDLDELFDTWLFTAGRPELPTAAARVGAVGVARGAPAAGTAELLLRLHQRRR